MEKERGRRTHNRRVARGIEEFQPPSRLVLSFVGRCEETAFLLEHFPSVSLHVFLSSHYQNMFILSFSTHWFQEQIFLTYEKQNKGCPLLCSSKHRLTSVLDVGHMVHSVDDSILRSTPSYPTWHSSWEVMSSFTMCVCIISYWDTSVSLVWLCDFVTMLKSGRDHHHVSPTRKSPPPVWPYASVNHEVALKLFCVGPCRLFYFTGLQVLYLKDLVALLLFSLPSCDPLQ